MANCLLTCGHGFSSSSLISTGGKFCASACWWSAACWLSALSSSSISISRDSAPYWCLASTPSSTLCSIHHCSEHCGARFLPCTMFFFFFLLSSGCNFQCSEVQYFSQNLL